MGGKSSKNKNSGGADKEESIVEGGVILLTIGEVREILVAMETPKKVGMSTRYCVKEEEKDNFVAAIKELDTPKMLDLLSVATGSASVDIFADASCSGVFWSTTTEDNPQDLIKYLENEKLVKFNENTVTMLTEPPGHVLYCALD